MKKTLFTMLAICLLAAGCGESAKKDESRYVVNLTAGSPSVDFLYRDMAGKPFRLSEQKGKVVLLYFWRMKCEACKEELKAIEALYRKFRDRGLVVVAVGADSMHSASLYDVSRFMEKEGFTFIKIRDEDGFVAEAYQVMRAPEAYLIDRDGRIAMAQKGSADWAGQVSVLIDGLLSGKR
ncbi:MAG TPA: hypothetical protein DDW94_00850 [Deltaproteobacteria bacterium]|nr:MAG: hypothetical protein A2Z79_06215 [Deltaproteobacteria bacterium GWA2_55_82]OGQ63365.1 MAG: hypothetical protein A3I81_03205 [Deltaproteobacteria bacterium RIFCSPLOWO2_02_FULL_55_12]OIJ73222.1 MAG: hypothetical protein A2V21_302445 [Deltaproteobacteria bacterium GWC2_55_46]HBG45518.1 hypothetical protein [Deltaproteobacteria bacterium]HCY10349.1 hypothetical protein [Deltaproteobacteria bacterium]